MRSLFTFAVFALLSVVGRANSVVLDATTESIEMETGSAVSTDYVAVWVDNTTTAFTPGNTIGNVATATTTAIVAAPAASTQRQLKWLTVKNRHASSAQTVTIKLDVSATEYHLTPAVSLAASEMLRLDGSGVLSVYDAQGRVKTVVTNASAVANTLNVVALPTDQTNANAVLNTLEDVTGLSFAVTATETYSFRCRIAYSSAATTTGSRWTINGPAATRLNYRSTYTLTATTLTSNYATAYQIPAASNATSLTTGNVAIIEGQVTPSSSGTIQVQHASEVAASTVTALAGSMCTWVRTL